MLKIWFYPNKNPPRHHPVGILRLNENRIIR